jgi:hypothetical protein
MDLFTLTCTTCKSRLKVRDPAAVGQILACPKCGGMVMIKPPPSWSEVSQGKQDLATATEVVGSVPAINQTVDSSAFDAVEELLSDAPPRSQPPPAKTPSTKAPFPGASPLPTPAPASPPGSGKSPSSATPTPGPSAPAKPRFVGGPPSSKSPAPAAPASAKAESKPPAGVEGKPAPATAAAAIAAPSAKPDSGPLATGAAGSRGSSAWKGPLQEPPPPPGEQPPTEKPVASGRHWWIVTASAAIGCLFAIGAVTAVIHFLSAPRENSPALARHSTATTPPAVQPAKGAAVEPPVAVSVPESPPLPVATKEPSTAAPVPPAVPSMADATQPLAAAAAPDKAAAAPDKAAADPLGLVKEPLPPPSPKVASSIAKFDRILGGPSDDPLANPTEPPPAPATDIPPARPLAPRPPPREVDAKSRLADSLPGVETAGTPLADFAQLFSDLTTIPITLDLPLIPATAESPITFTATDTTVGKALTDALATLRLEYTISDDQILVRRPEPKTFAALPAKVNDLTLGEEQRLAELVELLKAVVEPSAWSDGDDGGSLTANVEKAEIIIRQRRAVQAQVLVALEKLRTAHSPPLAHPWKLDPATFSLDTRYAQMRPKLEMPVTITYSQPTRLLTILERLGEVTGVRVLVDWHDVASVGWNPAGEATLAVNHQPLAAALDMLLAPLDLTWRIIDAQTIQVVTPAKLATQGELEFYRVDRLLGEKLNGQELLSRITALLGETNLRAGGGSGDVRIDAATGCLLAWLPQPSQRELEALLEKLRSE